MYPFRMLLEGHETQVVGAHLVYPARRVHYMLCLFVYNLSRPALNPSSSRELHEACPMYTARELHDSCALCLMSIMRVMLPSHSCTF